MITSILNFYKVGKELGLTKKEINQVMIFDNRKHAFLWRFLLFFVMLLILMSWFNTLLFLTQKINQNVYASGTLYSTVKLKEFKKKFHVI